MVTLMSQIKPANQWKEQKLLELEERVKLLKQQNNRLQHELEMKDHKVAFFDRVVQYIVIFTNVLLLNIR